MTGAGRIGEKMGVGEEDLAGRLPSQHGSLPEIVKEALGP